MVLNNAVVIYSEWYCHLRVTYDPVHRMCDYCCLFVTTLAAVANLIIAKTSLTQCRLTDVNMIASIRVMNLQTVFIYLMFQSSSFIVNCIEPVDLKFLQIQMAYLAFSVNSRCSAISWIASD